MPTAMSQLIVRQTRYADIPKLIELQKRVYPDIKPWPVERFAHQLEVFASGQLVATIDEQIVGGASSLIVKWDEWAYEHSWKEITTNGTFDNHDPEGLTLYGAEVFVDPQVRGKRIGHALYVGRRNICRGFNLRRIIACGRLPGYYNYQTKMSAVEYCQRVLWGDIQDPVLSFQLREGFRYCGVIENYIPEDLASAGFASLIVWLNPNYDEKKINKRVGSTRLSSSMAKLSISL